MTITGNEVAIDNQMRRDERQHQSPVNRLIAEAASTTEAISLATGSVAIGSIAKALGIAKTFTSGLGVATLEENLDHLGDAAEAALSRVEKNLEMQGVLICEIERRLNSNELLEGIKAATLQAQRTKDKKRLERMALILANGVAENDLEPESLDDMMRAAVELTDHDIIVLKSIYEMQAYAFTPAEMAKPYNFRVDAIRSKWKDWWKQEEAAYHADGGAAFRSSTVRLQSTGLIASIGLVDVLTGPSVNDFELLVEGKKFFEHLQEINTTI